MTNIERLKTELSRETYFDEKTDETYELVLEENNLDPFAEYTKENDQINLLEAVYSILQMLANNVEMYIKVETEFATTTAGYQHLQKRLKDLRNEIDRLKLANHYTDEDGNQSNLISYMFFNGRQR